MITVKVVTSERFDVTNANFVVSVVNLHKDKVDGIVEVNLLIKKTNKKLSFSKALAFVSFDQLLCIRWLPHVLRVFKAAMGPLGLK